MISCVSIECGHVLRKLKYDKGSDGNVAAVASLLVEAARWNNGSYEIVEFDVSPMDGLVVRYQFAARFPLVMRIPFERWAERQSALFETPATWSLPLATHYLRPARRRDLGLTKLFDWPVGQSFGDFRAALDWSLDNPEVRPQVVG